MIGLYAFHYEIARVQESVSDPVLGEIRLQWWREAVEEIRAGKAVRAHDAAHALAAAVKAAPLFPHDLLADLIDARERDLDPAPLDGLSALSAYAESTAGALVVAAAHLLSARPIALQLRAGLTAAGRAWGLAGLAREAAIAKQFNARPRLLITSAADEIAEEARAAHRQARAALAKAPSALLPAFAYAALVPSLTRRFSVEAASPLGMRWGILRAAITGGI